jgi:hypothetical protein
MLKDQLHLCKIQKKTFEKERWDHERKERKTEMQKKRKKDGHERKERNSKEKNRTTWEWTSHRPEPVPPRTAALERTGPTTSRTLPTVGLANPDPRCTSLLPIFAVAPRGERLKDMPSLGFAQGLWYKALCRCSRLSPAFSPLFLLAALASPLSPGPTLAAPQQQQPWLAWYAFRSLHRYFLCNLAVSVIVFCFLGFGFDGVWWCWFVRAEDSRE